MKEKKDYTKEIEFIKNWCITIMDFVSQKDPLFAKIVNSSKDGFRNTPTIINKKILSGYQQGFRDINEMAKALKPSEYKELNDILLQKHHKTLFDFDTKKEKKIESVIKKGKISNNEEYALVENKVSELSQEKGKDKEIDILNKLLIDYYKKP